MTDRELTIAAGRSAQNCATARQASSLDEAYAVEALGACQVWQVGLEPDRIANRAEETTVGCAVRTIGRESVRKAEKPATANYCRALEFAREGGFRNYLENLHELKPPGIISLC